MSAIEQFISQLQKLKAEDYEKCGILSVRYRVLQEIEELAKSLPPEPKFRVGDYIKHKWPEDIKDTWDQGKIIAIEDGNYIFKDGYVGIDVQDHWELAEEPANKDLEREIIRYKVPFNRDEECLDEVTLNKIVYHFVDWQKQHDRLEVAKAKAKNYQEGFKDCRKQMVKDAVEGYVTFCKELHDEGLPDCTVIADEKTEDFYKARGLKLGDRVKLVILPTDNK